MNNPSPNKPLTIVYYPSLQKMRGNPYWAMLESGIREAGIEILEEPESHKILWLFRNREKVDILHLHYIQSLYCNSGHSKARLVYVAKFALYLLLARLLGYRTVLTMHNLKPTHSLKPRWIDFLGHWIAVNFSERVIVHCREARGLMADRYGRKNEAHEVSHPNLIEYYPNQISKQDARQKLNLSENVRVFLFLGGVRPNKGLETLITAFKDLEDQNSILLIAGKPDTRNRYGEQLQQLASSDPRIRFHFGFIPDEELQVFYNASDIVVLPFTSILTSTSTILAMSFARPVIAPRMGCLPELLEPDAGWLYETEGKQTIMGCLKLAANCDYSNMGHKAYQKISAYNVNQFISDTMKCYLGIREQTH